MNDLSAIGVIILAAGASTRLGTPKQLLQYRGQSLLRHTAEVAIASGCRPIIVVLGAQVERLEAEVMQLPVYVVENNHWAEGMSSSIQTGLTVLQSIHPPVKAVVMLLCDQPFVSVSLVRQLIEAYHCTGKLIVASEYADTVGVPALFSCELFAELMMLDAVTGAKQVIKQHIQEVYPVSFPAGAIDLNTLTDCEQFEKMFNNNADGSLEKHSNWSCVKKAWD
ncbi:nucleotidyltransferase family protein [Chroococcidiopsis sp. FACHB-1243]|nr:nucleotidyltransferase family protein [Chroococcidiopsis sp. [FACHB-1243]]